MQPRGVVVSPIIGFIVLAFFFFFGCFVMFLLFFFLYVLVYLYGLLNGYVKICRTVPRTSLCVFRKADADVLASLAYTWVCLR